MLLDILKLFKHFEIHHEYIWCLNICIFLLQTNILLIFDTVTKKMTYDKLIL